MKNDDIPIKDPSEIRTEAQALDQSIALNRIVMSMLQHQKENNKRMFIALIISLFLNAFIVGGFLYYESQWEYATTTTTTTKTVDQKVEGENSSINNVSGDQYNDSATHNEGEGD